MKVNAVQDKYLMCPHRMMRRAFKTHFLPVFSKGLREVILTIARLVLQLNNR